VSRSREAGGADTGSPPGQPPDEVRVFDFQRADQEAVRELVLAGLGEHWGVVDASLNPDLDDIAHSYGDGRILVLRRGAQIVGTGVVMPRGTSTAEILRMSVAAGHRRSGLGRRLVEELTEVARGWGATEVVLETTSAWPEVVTFYLSCGFSITHREPGAFGEDTWFRREL
jgi:GNAT superfamily N-acetyltransferase